MKPREDINLFLLGVEKTFKFIYFLLKASYSLLKRLSIAPRESSSGQLIRSLALEPNACTLGTLMNISNNTLAKRYDNAKARAGAITEGYGGTGPLWYTYTWSDAVAPNL